MKGRELKPRREIGALLPSGITGLESPLGSRQRERVASRRACPRGFTMIEMLIAIIILYTGTLALLSMSALGVITLTESKQLSTATDLAQEKLEEMVTGSYAAVVSSSQGYGEISDYPKFSRNVVVQGDFPSTDFKTVEVTVSWVGRQDGQDHSVTLRTVISREGEF